MAKKENLCTCGLDEFSSLSLLEAGMGIRSALIHPPNKGERGKGGKMRGMEAKASALGAIK